MKSLFLKSLCVLAATVVLAFSTNANIEVINALKSGNAEQLAKYFDTYVDITLPDKKGSSYSKSQAMMVMRDFFGTYKVKSFEVQFQGGEKSNYFVGTLQTGNGNFRTTVFVQQKGDKSLVKEIRVEPK